MDLRDILGVLVQEVAAGEYKQALSGESMSTSSSLPMISPGI